ncbi:hypothetical protein [Marinobacter alexandrii]|uniref:hypothetical protein n=1 Tax=Marinobacter alexandrii TaxID=2570351 RepID=UPI001109F733|nr:hypothetical protein [Marinobacter alexandrii]
MSNKTTARPWGFRESDGKYISNEPFTLGSDEHGTTSSSILGADGKVVCIVPEAHNGQWADGERVCNIEHIVKCVNAHDELVEALREVVHYSQKCVLSKDDLCIDDALELLAKLDTEAK